MKLLTWNCQGAFRKKAGRIARYAPDIAVIQECECPEKLAFQGDFPPPTAQLWVGDNPWKGLGVFSFTGLELELSEPCDESLRYFLPVRVRGDYHFNLLAAWAMVHADPLWSYIGQVYRALERYADFIEAGETVLAGDLNSNQIFDRRPRIGNHSDVVARLAARGIVSGYHKYFRERHGEERHNTFYLYRNRFRGFHLDYCFLPTSWLRYLKSVSVGRYEQWKQASDHMPVFVKLDRRLKKGATDGGVKDQADGR
jgi:exonuclease III